MIGQEGGCTKLAGFELNLSNTMNSPMKSPLKSARFEANLTSWPNHVITMSLHDAHWPKNTFSHKFALWEKNIYKTLDTFFEHLKTHEITAFTIRV